MTGRESGLGEQEGGTPKRGPGRPPRDALRGQLDERIAAEREREEREQADDLELSDDERLELFRDSMTQSVLPDLPYVEGFHNFWATSSNPRDPIQRRIMLGYKLVRIEDFPGWEGTGIHAGGVDGVVGVNEMVGMRIPNRLYQKYMMEAHHNAPLVEEEKLRSQVKGLKEQLEEQGSGVVEEGSGTASLVQRAKQAPDFVRER